MSALLLNGNPLERHEPFLENRVLLFTQSTHRDESLIFIDTVFVLGISHDEKGILVFADLTEG